MALQSAMFVLCAICLSIVIPSSAVNVLSVSEREISFNLHTNASFNLNSSEPVSENVTIWFGYTDGNNLYPLPNSTFVENGTLIDLTFTLAAKEAGHTTVIAKVTPPILIVKDAYIRVGVYKYDAWNVISSIIGWLYFIAWSVSFYPQIIENYKRKSVIGLNFDFLGLNLTGFIAYSVFNIGLKYVKEVQLEYHTVHPTGIIPVETNDVVFAVHAVFATLVTIFQCFIYERGDQLIAKSTVAILALVWSTAGVFLLLTALHVNKYTPWLTFLYFFSYVKLGVTLTKYIPQVVYNYQRKSTVGWSIGTVLFDVVGGLFSIGQMFITAYNFEQWKVLIGNFVKFALGYLSIMYSFIFLAQHYYFYKRVPVKRY
ncbi:cystinosin isoform X2 [Parasteatoda tepidariorum]|uniref:cystinosin isoform X2 n=1 Tax=Parasteatoda tepidariorum TaxID=114398 RepID=UPI0039BD1FE8